MTNILVCGPKDPIGGVERVVIAYVENILKQHDDIHFDFVFNSDSFSLSDKLIGLGCGLFFLPSKTNDNKNYRKCFYKIFETKQYDVVWGNYSGLTNIDLIKLAKKFNVPKRIVHSHVNMLFWGNPIAKIIGPIIHSYNKKLLCNYATNFWACSKTAADFMFPDTDKISTTIINNAINTEFFSYSEQKRQLIRQELGISDKTLVIGHVARMCLAKNQIFLLEIMKEIVNILPDAKLLFVGDGELCETIKEATLRLDLQKNIIFTGERNDISNLLNAMDVFVLPSLSEGLGMCLIEAQACAVPCVASNNVPQTTDITATTQYLPLTFSAKDWATTIIEQADTKISNEKMCVIENGFDILVEAENVYLKFKGNKQ